MPEPDLALLGAAAQAAGMIALRHWRQAPRAWEKADGAGPVSEADLEVDAALAAQLRTARPDYGWLSEESVDGPERLGARRVFVIDPIDGTRAFLEGSDGFAIAIAVVEAGVPIAACVHLPARGETFTAARGGPARLTTGAGTRPLGPGPAPAPLGPSARVLTSKASFQPEHWQAGAVPPAEAVFRSSLAWRLCLVAEGRFDAALSFRPAWEWDLAAAALIAQCAGATVTDRTGAPLRFNRPRPLSEGLLVARAPLHAAMLARIAPSAAP